MFVSKTALLAVFSLAASVFATPIPTVHVAPPTTPAVAGAPSFDTPTSNVDIKLIAICEKIDGLVNPPLTVVIGHLEELKTQVAATVVEVKSLKVNAVSSKDGASVSAEVVEKKVEFIKVTVEATLEHVLELVGPVVKDVVNDVDNVVDIVLHLVDDIKCLLGKVVEAVVETVEGVPETVKTTVSDLGVDANVN